MKQKVFLAAITLAVSIGLAASSASAQAPGKAPKAPGPGAEKAPGPGAEKAPGKAPEAAKEPKVDLSATEIMRVQEALRKEGFQPGEEGKLDSKTQQALRDYQKKNKLPVTGQPDQETIQKLGVKITKDGKAPGAKPGATPERSPMPGPGTPKSPGKGATP